MKGIINITGKHRVRQYVQSHEFHHYVSSRICLLPNVHIIVRA